MNPKIPSRLIEASVKVEGGSRWLSDLPNMIKNASEHWKIEVSEPFDSPDVSCAWVAEARRTDGSTVVLKIGMPHMEAMDEIAGLRFWDGAPTVRLLDADDEANAMLLERCIPGSSLRQESADFQDEIVARLLRTMWRKPTHATFRPLSELTTYWCQEAVTRLGTNDDERVVREGVSLMEELANSPSDDVLLATDLHAGNILRSEREPWLVIDPKPFVGDPAFDATQHLFNNKERLFEDPRRVIGDFALKLGVDPERVWLWAFARTAIDAPSTAPRLGRPL
ncbi:MAG: aminoglycoside phosphotransferase family protein [Actinobacteria bacterium]|nr:aminoglycoside phosphotransferase family protein [Actinomycetota bacterium]